MSPLTVATLILGALLPGGVLLCQCLLFQSQLRQLVVPFLSEPWIPMQAESTAIGAGLLAAVAMTYGMLWIVSVCRRN